MQQGDEGFFTPNPGSSLDYAPVILEVARKSDYASFDIFKKAVRSNTIDMVQPLILRLQNCLKVLT